MLLFSPLIAGASSDTDTSQTAYSTVYPMHIPLLARSFVSCESQDQAYRCQSARLTCCSGQYTYVCVSQHVSLVQQPWLSPCKPSGQQTVKSGWWSKPCSVIYENSKHKTPFYGTYKFTASNTTAALVIAPSLKARVAWTCNSSVAHVS